MKERTLSHLDDSLRPQMVDISNKPLTKRTAIAVSSIILNADIVNLFNETDIISKKGAVFNTAILAGIQAVKETYRIIPLCHPIPISACTIDIELQDTVATITCKVISMYATGVEMEAIMGASIAAITIYDMCKGINSDMIITNTKLISKTKE